MEKIKFPWVEETSLPWRKTGGSYVTEISLSVYSLEAVMKTCYLFLDQCYLFIEPEGDDKVRAYFSPQNPTDDLTTVIGEFSIRLLWQETRRRVADETRKVREMIVEQAFAEAAVSYESLTGDATEADYNSDPLGIAR